MNGIVKVVAEYRVYLLDGELGITSVVRSDRAEFLHVGRVKQMTSPSDQRGRVSNVGFGILPT